MSKATLRAAIGASAMAVILVGCDPRDDANHPHDIQAWGYGPKNTCATWLTSSESRAAGNEWILGYWTGQNVRNVRDHEVGRSSDASGILNEVRSLCRATPDDLLASAAGRVYVNFERDHR